MLCIYFSPEIQRSRERCCALINFFTVSFSTHLFLFVFSHYISFAYTHTFIYILPEVVRHWLISKVSQNYHNQFVNIFSLPLQTMTMTMGTTTTRGRVKKNSNSNSRSEILGSMFLILDSWFWIPPSRTDWYYYVSQLLCTHKVSIAVYSFVCTHFVSRIRDEGFFLFLVCNM